ncbi:MAG TPA: DUF1736 domain-containing protein, partial [Myxococcota bacterium]|nr:DUF1736 domain-containing protein [Myxococcota bacterium]
MNDDRGSAVLGGAKRWELAVLAALPLLLYLPTLEFGYVLDDKIAVEENAFVQQGIRGIGAIFGSESFAGFVGEQPSRLVGARYRPLSLATFALEHELYGLNASRSHLINVVLYAVTTLVVYRFFRALVSGRASDRGFARLPFLAALLFALHPLHSEVVANIKGRDEILALLLSLASVLALLRFARQRSAAALALSGSSFLLALLAKENAITFLAVAPLTLFVFTEARPRRLGAAMLPLIAAGLLYLALRYHALGFALLGDGAESADLMNNPFLEASTAQRYGTIFYTWGVYLKLLLFPHPLTHDYYPYQIPLVGIADARAIAPLVAFLAMLAGGVALLRGRGIAAWSLLYFLATFSIVSNLFFSVGTFMNERFLFMPSVGFCLLLAWILLSKLPGWLGAWPRLARRAPLAIAALFALGFA